MAKTDGMASQPGAPIRNSRAANIVISETYTYTNGVNF